MVFVRKPAHLPQSRERRCDPRHMQHIDRKSRSRWGGVGQSPRVLLLTDLCPSHLEIFFPQPRILGRCLVVSNSAGRGSAEKAESFQWALAANDNRIAPTAALFPDLFSPPGGRSKVWKVSIRHRWARNTNFFGSFRELFFRIGTLRSRA